VRGIAAMMVLVGHSYGEYFSSFLERHPLWALQIFWDGLDAVGMFFILSGYVLTLQISSQKTKGYAGFVVRRFFRIWPPFAVAIVLASVLFLSGNLAGIPMRAVGTNLVEPSLSPHSFFANLLMIGDPNAIDPPVWSLFIEMRVSLVFPLIMMLVLNVNAFLAIFLGLCYSMLVSRLMHSSLGQAVFDFAGTSRFVYLFVFGAALAVANNPIVQFFDRTGVAARTAILLSAIVLLEYRIMPWSAPLKNDIPSVGVALLFLICLRSPTAARVLERRPLLFLGRISYSLYLVHYPMLVFVLSVNAQQLPRPLAASLLVIASIITAWLLYLSVEKPMMALGRKLDIKLSASAAPRLT
jgi:peptidoglycan/LPS O-acetylase OafA/YrhL